MGGSSKSGTSRTGLMLDSVSVKKESFLQFVVHGQLKNSEMLWICQKQTGSFASPSFLPGATHTSRLRQSMETETMYASIKRPPSMATTATPVTLPRCPVHLSTSGFVVEVSLDWIRALNYSLSRLSTTALYGSLVFLAFRFSLKRGGGSGSRLGISMVLLMSVPVPLFLICCASTGRHGSGKPYGELQASTTQWAWRASSSVQSSYQVITRLLGASKFVTVTPRFLLPLLPPQLPYLLGSFASKPHIFKHFWGKWHL